MSEKDGFFSCADEYRGARFPERCLTSKTWPDAILAGKKAHEYFGILIGSPAFFMEVGQEILVPGNQKSKQLYNGEKILGIRYTYANLDAGEGRVHPSKPAATFNTLRFFKTLREQNC